MHGGRESGKGAEGDSSRTLAPRGSRPTAGLRGPADGSGAREGLGNTHAAAGNVATRTLWQRHQRLPGPCGQELRMPQDRTRTPEGRSRPAGKTGKQSGPMRISVRKDGSKGQGTAEGRGELRLWDVRMPAAATVGAGSNADPHFVFGGTRAWSIHHHPSSTPRPSRPPSRHSRPPSGHSRPPFVIPAKAGIQ